MPGRTNRVPSDYESGRSGNTTAGPNDQTMAPKGGGFNDTMNSGIDAVLEMFGYDGDRRANSEENDFYRDNAQYMPGYNINGIPSGAWAQDRATNYVGHPDHNTPEENEAWDYVRRSLVEKQSGMIDESLANGGDGSLSFMDVYGAHVEAYNEAPNGNNSFIDPVSFGAAVYVAPALEALGIDSGPLTGASIDFFNDPTDSATEGWAKRMGLAGGEMAAGLGLMTTGVGFLPGLALLGAGAFGMGYNTASAIGNGMLGEWGDAIGDGVGWLGDTASSIGGSIADGASSLWEGAQDVGGSILDAGGDLLSSAGSAIGSLFSW